MDDVGSLLDTVHFIASARGITLKRVSPTLVPSETNLICLAEAVDVDPPALSPASKRGHTRAAFMRCCTLNTDYAKVLLSYCEEAAVTDLVVMYKKATHPALQQLRSQTHMHVYVDCEDVFVKPLLSHASVPRLCVVSSAEVHARFSGKLPGMSVTDAVSKQLGLREGDVVMYEEVFPLLPPSVQFREVVPEPIV